MVRDIISNLFGMGVFGKNIVNNNYIGEAGAYVSNVKDDGTQYICYISDANGTVVDAIAISYSGENLGKI